MKLTHIVELESTVVLGACFEVHASDLRARHEQNDKTRNRLDGRSTAYVNGLMNVLNVLVNQFHDVDGLIARLSEVNQCVTNGLLASTRRFELEALQAGQVRFSQCQLFVMRTILLEIVKEEKLCIVEVIIIN